MKTINLSLSEVIKKLTTFGYVVKYKDGDRFTELYIAFGNSEIEVSNTNELQIGRGITICNKEVTSKPFLKRGWMWSGSAEIQQKKGNIYTFGDEKTICKIK